MKYFIQTPDGRYYKEFLGGYTKERARAGVFTLYEIEKTERRYERWARGEGAILIPLEPILIEV